MNKSISILLAGDFLLLLLSSFVFPVDSKGPSTNPLWKQKPRFLDVDSRWADSLMLVMSPEERIAQLFMVAAYSNRDQVHEAEIMHLVTEHKVGGLIFFQGGPMRQAHLTNRYQSAARVPLMIGIDGEWGLAMRLDSTMKFPKQMT
ncbi:MAG TPA: glycoside hydrolase family 3 N-terminal domain-containing protein, partial [Flavobacteriales bacterium]|nr:glycoside hydrolase family 3 N-terminal domain-containing protein [Flavobacteriales bacterium]